MPARNYQGTHYSELDQINTTDAKDWKKAWSCEKLGAMQTSENNAAYLGLAPAVCCSRAR